MTLSDPTVTEHQAGTDTELARSVRQAMTRNNPLRMWGDCVEIQDSGRAIILSGMVRSVSTKEQAEVIARHVAGVNRVENHLVVDTEIELAIAQALGNDPRTQRAFPGILVGVTFGVAYLKGRVATGEIKAAAAEVASKLPGVRTVSNELTVAPVAV